MGVEPGCEICPDHVTVVEVKGCGRSTSLHECTPRCQTPVRGWTADDPIRVWSAGSLRAGPPLLFDLSPPDLKSPGGVDGEAVSGAATPGTQVHPECWIGADDPQLSPGGQRAQRSVDEQVSAGGEAEVLQVERAGHGRCSGSVTAPAAS